MPQDTDVPGIFCSLKIILQHIWQNKTMFGPPVNRAFTSLMSNAWFVFH